MRSSFKIYFALIIFIFGIAYADTKKVDEIIKKKSQEGAVLVFSQGELSKALIVRLIETQQSFVLVDLENREKLIEMLEKIFEKNNMRYKIAKELTSEDKWEEISMFATIGAVTGASVGGGIGSIPGGIIGGIGGLAYGAWSVADDVTGGIFSRTPEYKIIQLKDEKQLKVQYVKKEEEENNGN